METKDITYKLLFFGIIITIFYLLIVGSFSFKISNEEQCGSDVITSYSNGELTSSYILNNNSALFQEFNPVADDPRDREKSNYLGTMFSFSANASEPLLVQVVDMKDNILGSTIVSTGYDSYNVQISDTCKENNCNIGIYCPECDSDSNITLYEEIGGSIQKQLLINSFSGLRNNLDPLDIYYCDNSTSCNLISSDGFDDYSINSYNSNSMDFRIISKKTCHYEMKSYYQIYVWLILVTLLCIGIFIYYDTLKFETEEYFNETKEE
jgi:hypothetical protein